MTFDEERKAMNEIDIQFKLDNLLHQLGKLCLDEKAIKIKIKAKIKEIQEVEQELKELKIIDKE